MCHLLKSGNCVFLTEQFYVFLRAVVALNAYFISVTTLTTHVAPSLFFSHFPVLHFWCYILQSRIFHPLHFWPRLCRKFQSCIFSAPRQSSAVSGETVDKLDEISLPYHDTALASAQDSRPAGHTETQQAIDCIYLASESRCGRPQGRRRGWANADKSGQGGGPEGVSFFWYFVDVLYVWLKMLQILTSSTLLQLSLKTLGPINFAGKY